MFRRIDEGSFEIVILIGTVHFLVFLHTPLAPLSAERKLDICCLGLEGAFNMSMALS